VVELGIVIWVLIGWQFTLAELLGGLVLIASMALLLRVFISRPAEEQAREHARAIDSGHQHHSAGERMSLGRRLSSAAAWSNVAHNFRNDWAMLYREIAIGFLLAGFVGLLGNDFFNGYIRDDRARGACDRRAVQRRRPHPPFTAHPRRHLRQRESRLQALHEHPRCGGLRGAVRVDDTSRRDRPGLRHAG
jgi:uncharacterized membrane protein YraQ (UPF0718 family)